MIPAFYIGSLYWWPFMIALCYAHYRWSIHLCDRLTSKARKHPDNRLPKKSKIAARVGIALVGFYVAHLAIVSWTKPVEALVIWFCCYLVLTIWVVQNIRALRTSLREYHAILETA